METEKDFWYWLSLLVSVIAMLVWAFASVITPDSAGFAWCAGTIIAVAAGSVAVRAWLKARRIVWTEELREVQRRRAWEQLWETIPMGLFFVGVLVSWIGW